MVSTALLCPRWHLDQWHKELHMRTLPRTSNSSTGQAMRVIDYQNCCLLFELEWLNGKLTSCGLVLCGVRRAFSNFTHVLKRIKAQRWKNRFSLKKKKPPNAFEIIKV
jgi:hypothetical protein